MSETQEAQATTNASEQTNEISTADKLYPAEAKTEAKAEPEKQADAKVEPAAAETKAVEDSSSAEASDSPDKPNDETQAKPDKYTFEVDEDSLLKDEHLDKIAAIASEQGLSQEAAQKLADTQAEALKQFQTQLAEDFKEQAKAWKDTAAADKEIGGNEFNRNIELAKRVVDRFATPEFKKALNDSGFGNHPELLRTFVRIGQQMGEDTLVVPGAKNNVKSRSVEDLFYGSNN